MPGVLIDIQNLVDREFKNFNIIKKEEIEELEYLSKFVDGIAIFEINKGAITCSNFDVVKYSEKKVPSIISMLKEISQKYTLPDTKFALNLLDEARVVEVDSDRILSIPTGYDYTNWMSEKGESLNIEALPLFFAPIPHVIFHRCFPIFSVSKINGFHSDILFPSLGIYRLAKARVIDNIEWKQKKEILYWRGSSTGGLLTLDNWFRFPRVKLSIASKSHSFCDVGISRILQANLNIKKNLIEIFNQYSIMKPWEPFKNYLGYQYLFDIDGNTFSSRLKYFLGSNSLIVKYPTVWEEFYHFWLQPGVHYIQSKSDFSNFEYIFEWGQTYPSQVQDIIFDSKNFFEKYLSLDFIGRYIQALLLRYESLIQR